MAAEFDYIIVGGGTAGCVVATRLSEDPHRRVLMVEAGPRDRNPFIAIPGASAFTLAAQELNWHRMTEPQAELGGRSLYLAQGRVIGGSSSINGMVYTRGSPHDYAGWVEEGADGWSYDDVLPWFLRAETHSNGASEWHGASGPLQVQRGKSGLGAVDAFLSGAKEIGLPLCDDVNNLAGEGIGHYDWMVGNGRRSSAASAYLKPALNRTNLSVITGAQVTKINMAGDRARGVEFIRDGKREQVHSTGEIILAGGAVNSPALLMLSGLGPADHLREMGIDVLLDQPMIGSNLKNHLSYQFSYRCSAPVSAFRYLNPLHGSLEVAKYLFARRGFFADASAPAGGFYRSSDQADAADMQAFMVPIILGGLGAGLRALLPREHGLSFFVNQGRPFSSGTVRLRSADPSAPPVLNPRYLSDPRDLAVMVDGIARMMDIVRTDAFRAIGAEQVGGPEGPGRDAIEASLRAQGGQHYHVCGTCRMGTDPHSSVVDSRLRLHGIDGLRVVDASIMPRLINANLAAPVMMIAERAASFIRDENG